MRPSKSIDKYLQHYAEPQARVEINLGRPFADVVVIPAYDESEALWGVLTTIPEGAQGEVLTVLVLNAPPDEEPSVYQRARAVVGEIRARFGKPRGVADGLDLFEHPRGAMLLVERLSPNRYISARQGVGLARKLGCDIALKLQREQTVASPWIHTTDADVELPADYFHRARRITTDGIAALVYPFSHRCEPPAPLAAAIRKYELFLRYYVLGLASAGSPFAFQTLGSTIAIEAKSYAEVRGFPKRNAGEDFYVLNKLAKVGGIVRPPGDPILIRGRVSHRVPFGTGASLRSILETESSGKKYETYAPEVFGYLSVWLRLVEQFHESRGNGDVHRLVDAISRANPVV